MEEKCKQTYTTQFPISAVISGFAVNSNLIECCLFNFQITKHFDFSIKFQVYWTGRCNLHYNCLLLQYQQLWQVSRAQHCAMQCWLPVAEKGSALKSLTPSQKLQEGQQKGAMSNTELSGLKEAFGQRCDHRTVLLTWTSHALPNQIGLLLYFLIAYFTTEYPLPTVFLLVIQNFHWQWL